MAEGDDDEALAHQKLNDIVAESAREFMCKASSADCRALWVESTLISGTTGETRECCMLFSSTPEITAKAKEVLRAAGILNGMTFIGVYSSGESNKDVN